MTVRVRLRAINNDIITRGLLQSQEDRGQVMESESRYVDDMLPVPRFVRLKVKWLYPESIRLLRIHEHHA